MNESEYNQFLLGSQCSGETRRQDGAAPLEELAWQIPPCHRLRAHDCSYTTCPSSQGLHVGPSLLLRTASET